MALDRQRKQNWGRTVIWIVVLIIIGIALGITIASRAQEAPERKEPEDLLAEKVTVLDMLRAPACAVPVIALTLLVLGVAAAQGYYSVQRLEAQRRIQKAEAAEREEEVRLRAVQTQRRLRELNDLTVNLGTGEEVARLMEGPDGELLLVRPGLATKPVSRIDPDEVREDSDQVRVAAMLANATRHAGAGGGSKNGGQSALSLEMAALAMLQGNGNTQNRLPGKVRILSPDEMQMLEEKQQG
jgi:hypothetical protein